MRVSVEGRQLDAAVWVLPGQAEDTLTLSLGYGRRRAGRVGTAQGFDAYALRTAAAPWIATGLQIRKTGETYKLASTQGMQSMDTPDGGYRPLVRETTLEEYRKEPGFAKEEEPVPGLTLYKPYPYKEEDYAWDGHRRELVHRLQQLHAGLPIGEQHRRRRQRAGRHRPPHALDSHRHLLPGRPRQSQSFFQPVPCMQCETRPAKWFAPSARRSTTPKA